ncbi:1-aminocyclopropane-1-carboxylate synthase-like protein 1 isoform X2 [Ptychodera flava]|uniref:1-aminocyclopropane-1-carboxylate synthase-like protein 1 isoform X2 n=1 Tax=Ptychodera flava TaxID=63121 RepID=UPI003969F336
MLSKRGVDIQNATKVTDIGFAKCLADPYNAESNPNGIINAGTSENTISCDIVAEKLSQVEPLFNKDVDILRYHDYTGLTSFKNTLCTFLTKHAKAHKQLDQNNLVVLNGCGSCLAALSLVLSDPGDEWLTMTPYSPVVKESVEGIPLTDIFYGDLCSQTSGENGKPFQLTVDMLEDALGQATQKDINIRGLFLINPHNPLGDIYSKQLLMDCLHFAKRHGLHVIVDEIYMLSVFDEEAEFTSVLSLEDLPDPDRTHFTWSFSKDFSISGLRCGVIYSWNKEILSAVAGVAYWFALPTVVQVTLNSMLCDEEWVAQTYLPTNRKRLRNAHEIMSKGLTRLGIPHLARSAGLYIWADFRKVMATGVYEAEMEMFYELIDAGVYITPGQGFYCKEPGWFRIVFALPRDVQDQVLHRIGTVIEMKRKKSMKPKEIMCNSLLTK